MTAHTRQGRRRAMAWSDRLIADLGSPVTPMLAHILAWRRRDRTLVHSETVRGLHARDRAHSARASESTGTICKAGCRPWVSGQTDALTHLCAGGLRERLLSIQKRCGGCMPVAAHTRQGRRGALARSDRLTADLGSPDTPMLAHALAWRRHDRFRPSRFLTNSPCRQGRYPSALGGRYRAYGRSSLSVKVCACRNF